MNGTDATCAIVTGSTSGIGRRIAEALHERGYAVVLNAFGDRETGERLVRQFGERAIYVDGDVGDPADVERLRDAALNAFGRIDVLVNNAGIARPIPHGDLDAVSDEFWDAVMRVNLKGPWNTSRACRAALAERRGQIVNIASIAGLRADGSSVPYAVSKAGVVHLTRLLAKALGPEVRVNAIAPGYIDTPLTHEWDAVRERILSSAPSRRLGTVDDAAQAVLALIGLDYVTGQILAVDGGVSLA